MTKPVYLFKFFCPPWVFRRLFRSFNMIISTSRFMADELYSLGISPEKVEIIPPGVNIPSFDTNQERAAETHNFLFFGTGSSNRGLPDAIAAFDLLIDELPEARLTLCLLGFHGLEEKILRNRIGNSKNRRAIILKGFEPDIAQSIRSADVVVLPFRTPFAHSQPPLTVLESMMWAKPVVTTHTGSISELISDGETGFLSPPGDIKSIAQKMLVACDVELAGGVGVRAREYVKRIHDIKAVTEKTIQVYQKVANEFNKKV